MTPFIKTPLIVTMLGLLLVDCSSKKLVPINSLKDVLTNLAPTKKTFDIKPTEESLLKGDKGTLIYVPAGAFQFADGTLPIGTVNIEIKECYTLAEMIAENLSTTSGPSILETAGMIYFNATANGKPLFIKDGKAFVIGFPKGKQDKEMDLFYDFAYNDTSSTWVPDYGMYEAEAMKAVQTDPAVVSEGIETDDISVKYPFELTDDLFDYGFTVALSTGTFSELKLVGQNRTILDYINDPTTIADSIARGFVKNNWRVHFDLNIDANGKMKNLRAENDEFTKYNSHALKIVKEYLENAPAFDLSKKYDEKVKHDWNYSLGIMGTRGLNQGRFKKKFRQQYSQYTDKAIQKMDKGAVESYIFSATKMGWINCDRFWDIDKDQKTDFIVTAPSGKDTKVQLVFKDINSIMNGTYQNGQFVFPNVPLGRQVKVIGISYANGKPTMGVAVTTIYNNTFELQTFKEFSLDDLEEELNH